MRVGLVHLGVRVIGDRENNRRCGRRCKKHEEKQRLTQNLHEPFSLGSKCAQFLYHTTFVLERIALAPLAGEPELGKVLRAAAYLLPRVFRLELLSRLAAGKTT